jgi:hypothetical protein
MKTKIMPHVLSCSVRECAYNDQEKCCAGAITVNGPEPLCGTYFKSRHKGGMESPGAVGACKNERCIYNESLECASHGIQVTFRSGRPACKTFSEKSEQEVWDV